MSNSLDPDQTRHFDGPDVNTGGVHTSFTYDNQGIQATQNIVFVLKVYVPVNNFLVMLGYFLG